MSVADEINIPKTTCAELSIKLTMRYIKTKLNFYPPVLLAPMAGITDSAFRLICRQLGAGLAVSEMISSCGILHGNKKTLSYFDFFKEEKPVSFQIFGNDPEIMTNAAVKLEKAGIDYLDINLGCSVPKIKAAGAGSVLSGNLPLVKEIIQSIKESTKVPVTAKIRLSPLDTFLDTLKLARTIQEAGASFLTIHARTPQALFKGRADWEIIKFIKENIDIPVIGNGDITTPQSALDMLEKGYCDAVMVGRGALGNPWIFEKIKKMLQGEEINEVTAEEKKKIILKHLELFIKKNASVEKFLKHLAWYSKGMPNASSFRQKVFLIKSLNELHEAINSFWK